MLKKNCLIGMVLLGRVKPGFIVHFQDGYFKFGFHRLDDHNGQRIQVYSIRGQSKVGNRLVNMHIDQTSGHYWFKPVITGRLVVDWSIEKTWSM